MKLATHTGLSLLNSGSELLALQWERMRLDPSGAHQLVATDSAALVANPNVRHAIRARNPRSGHILKRANEQVAKNPE